MWVVVSSLIQFRVCVCESWNIGKGTELNMSFIQTSQLGKILFLASHVTRCCPYSVNFVRFVLALPGVAIWFIHVWVSFWWYIIGIEEMKSVNKHVKNSVNKPSPWLRWNIYCQRCISLGKLISEAVTVKRINVISKFRECEWKNEDRLIFSFTLYIILGKWSGKIIPALNLISKVVGCMGS